MIRPAAALLLLAACGGGDGAFRPLAVGDPAPEYAGVTLAGDSLALAGLEGRAVLVNVWATWCPPCVEEMPALDALQRSHGPRGLEVVAVSIDTGADGDQVEAFVADHDLSMTVLHDPARRIERAFRTVGVPETFLIGPDGRIAARWIGAVDPAAVEAAVEAALPPGGAARRG